MLHIIETQTPGNPIITRVLDPDGTLKVEDFSIESATLRELFDDPSRGPTIMGEYTLYHWREKGYKVWVPTEWLANFEKAEGEEPKEALRNYAV